MSHAFGHDKIGALIVVIFVQFHAVWRDCQGPVEAIDELSVTVLKNRPGKSGGKLGAGAAVIVHEVLRCVGTQQERVGFKVDKYLFLHIFYHSRKCWRWLPSLPKR